MRTRHTECAYYIRHSLYDVYMNWRDELVNRLSATVPCGYELRGPAATEPTCLSAIALFLEGRFQQSLQALQWLSPLQNDDGSVGPTATSNTPGWPTTLAILAHAYVTRGASADVLGVSDEAELPEKDGVVSEPRFRRAEAIQWLIDTKPDPPKKSDLVEQAKVIGHDATLIGWPWVTGTHSWIEPTALAVLALKGVGKGDHPRTREGLRLLRDRLLPDGGCNYGNTTVLGQTLRPHIQPTALALLALFGEADTDGRIARSLDYLHAAINEQTAAASLAYALCCLGRYGRAPQSVDAWLAAAARRRSTVTSPYRQALLLLAARAARAPAAEGDVTRELIPRQSQGLSV